MRGHMRNLCVGVIAAAAVGGLAAAAPGAVLVNPSFEAPDVTEDTAGAPGWGQFNAAFTSVAAGGNTGDQALKVFGPFFQFGGAGVVQGGFAAAPGELWQASAFVQNLSTDAIQGSNFAVVKLEFLDAGNNVVGFAESPQITALTPQDTWLPFTAQGIAPAGTSTAQIVLVHVQLNNPVTGGAVFFDDAALGVVVPEPASLAVLGLGGLALARRRRA